MPERRTRREGEPGRRPEQVCRDGSPRRELAHWLRGWLVEHGDPTIDTILRGLPQDQLRSRSALAKALRGDTFADKALLRAVLQLTGAASGEIDDWLGYWGYLDYLERHRRAGGHVTAQPPHWETKPDPGALKDTAGPADTVTAPEDHDNDRRPGHEDGHRARSDHGIRRGTRRPAVIAALLGLIAGISLTLIGFVIYPADTPAPVVDRNPASARIIMPGTTTVPKTFQLAGSYRDLPPGTLLWVATFDPTKRLYFPQDKPCVAQPDGAFDCGQYYVGDQDAPDSAPYRLDVIVADATASNAFLQYQIDKGGPTGPDQGLRALPPGAVVISSRDVRRMP